MNDELIVERREIYKEYPDSTCTWCAFKYTVLLNDVQILEYEPDTPHEQIHEEMKKFIFALEKALKTTHCLVHVQTVERRYKITHGLGEPKGMLKDYLS